MRILKNIWKNETVCCIAFVLAVASAFLVTPDKEYFAYPDYRTIALLFCLMIIVAGFQSKGVFARIGHFLLKRAGSIRALSAVMVLLCFFCSMVITNDVTLITFVPFTMLVFRMIGETDRLVKLVVLETIAANLGSMATPIGNPQNLYLYSISGLGMGEFALAVLPYAGLSLVLLMAAVVAGRDEPLMDLEMREKKKKSGVEIVKEIFPFLILLILCLLVVFHVLNYIPVLLLVIVVIGVVNKRLYLEVDYFLLLTFLFFFVFVGNMKRIPLISDLLMDLVAGRELLTGVLASQVISNVPAAILLSGFCEDFSALLTGVNLGGLGTLIASLASLISYKIFTREYPESRGRFLAIFTFWNLLFLLLLLGAAAGIRGRIFPGIDF
ncbi:SLC13 family permease [uncultured Merdimonas sp.]|uniref:SLC13 family permease n=1 Tax=uncultured Merdimonas sp. TaxID=2023269 RepID=UPI0032082F9C